jgi:cytoskeletal protein CcmA (bactofilin family)
MPRRNQDDTLGVIGTETIIGAGVVVNGELTSDSDITIDGALDGDIKSGGDVTVGINARIKANIQAINVSVAGHLSGNITATGTARIAESGHVKGDITASSLAISSGGVFIGQSRMETGPRLVDQPPSSEDAKPPEDIIPLSKPRSRN